MRDMSDPELDDVQGKIERAQVAAKDLADRDVIDPDAVEGQVPRQTDGPAADDEPDQPASDKG